jgi:tetratricopeptide (TPR) repeat protein
MDNLDFSQFIPKDRGNRTIEDKIKELEECPFFMTQLPKDPTSNPQLNAIQQLAYDGTPDGNKCAIHSKEIAENFKNQGNEWFKEGKYKDAAHYYGKAIEAQPNNIQLLSILYSNRAAAHLELGKNLNSYPLENYRMAMNDSQQAIAMDSKNKKAFFRAAKSAFGLKDVQECLRFCHDGLEVT